MKKNTFCRIICLCLVLLMTAGLLSGCSAVAQQQLLERQESEDEVSSETTAETVIEENTVISENVTEEEPEPEPIKLEKTSTIYTISFAGDCTLGTDYESYSHSSAFVNFVGDNYDHPFANSLQYFAKDDMTIVNLECVFSDYNIPVQKSFRFRGPPENVNFPKAGSIEVVNMSNNHIYDFGQTGYDDTVESLESGGIVYAEKDSTAIYTTDSGLVVGIYAAQFYVDTNDMASDIAKLREQGAEIVIFSCHWGSEGQYRPAYDQQSYAHAAIDAGADIVFGHHPHVLQPIEEYNGKMIYYSLGNFAYGGHANPRDKDSAIIQQRIIRDADGTIRLGETILIPYCLSSERDYNDYCPTPYPEDDEAYERTMSKLLGTYTGPDLYFYYGDDEDDEEEETEGDTETSGDGDTSAEGETPPE